ncbi:hypothetical protein LJ656_19205 [Paraburkholderia sp. MMS20-SJTR3]|uniref:Uncharacterized protein n=1 Tax=Paraburkholderia sejongensis TaxID=2886946 RepID=A0ABS8JYA8_9BURK|nr:hypothetical protein [Paraburkholderia sp. MMS20-SJTR3]MCC8394725.1 hypothetical protein [Paraburkholderia sp. MMS20-SJTR3]
MPAADAECAALKLAHNNTPAGTDKKADESVTAATARKTALNEAVMTAKIPRETLCVDKAARTGTPAFVIARLKGCLQQLVSSAVDIVCMVNTVEQKAF